VVACLLKEVWDLLVRRRLEDEILCLAIDDIRRSVSEASRSGGPIAGKDSIVEADEEFGVPPEGPIVRPPKDETHGFPISRYESSILWLDLGGPVAGQDPPDLLDRHRDTLHRGRGGYGLRLKVSPQATYPCAGKWPPVVEPGSPLIEFVGEWGESGGVIDQHARRLPLEGIIV